jgi:acyl-CoA synthetase (AMP-forming)/AMP-acid ligase II
LEPGEIGEIAVKGPQVTQAYHARPAETSLSKIIDFDEISRLWHRMGDLGYLDPQGRLWFCGRKSHRVQTSAGDLYTESVERIFNEHPAVRRTALVGIGVKNAQTPVLCVELEPDTATSRWSEIERELRVLGASNDNAKHIDKFLLHPKFPVDVRHNAKIFREKLAKWAAEQTR